jgi:hypothetical protein
MKYFSRKFILTLIVLILSAVSPYIYKQIDVSDTVALAVLAIFGGVGVAYGFINVQDAKLDKQ